MKKMVLVLLLVILIIPVTVHAGNATAFTYTPSPDGRLARSQDAYLPGVMLGRGLHLRNPSDIYVRDGILYIADTGAARIVLYNLSDGTYSYVGQDVLRAPAGVFVAEDGLIYVADPALPAVVVFCADGEVVQTFNRPTERIFGSTTPFRPMKVVVDRVGGVYIVSEGTFDGIIHLNRYGQFMGFFGFNFTQFSLWDLVRERFFTEAQQAQIIARRPPPFTNIAIDYRGIIYTVTQNNLPGTALQIHDIAGNNIIRRPIFDETNFVSVAVGRFRQIYTITATGLIFVYDGAGNLLYTFGGQSIANERSGFVTNATAIAADEFGYIFVLCGSRGYVYVYYPTDFVYNTYRAILAYNGGYYELSRYIWGEVLRLSGISQTAHWYIAQTYLQTQNYVMAAHHAYIAGVRYIYSDAFWELRNQWMLGNLLYVVIGGFILIVGIKIKNFAKIGASRSPVQFNMPETVRLLGRVIRHPFDTFYDIRREDKGSVKGATCLYLLAYLVFSADFMFRGFIFNFNERNLENLTYVTMLFFLPVILWVCGNYLVGSINEGEGRFRDVYVMTALALAPLILFMPFVTLATHASTINEEFLINTATGLIWLYCAVLLVIGLKEIHDYTFKQSFKSVLYTLFFMGLAVIVTSIISTFWGELIDFSYTLGEEAIFRVGG